MIVEISILMFLWMACIILFFISNINFSLNQLICFRPIQKVALSIIRIRTNLNSLQKIIVRYIPCSTVRVDFVKMSYIFFNIQVVLNYSLVSQLFFLLSLRQWSGLILNIPLAWNPESVNLLFCFASCIFCELLVQGHWNVNSTSHRM